MAAAELVLGAMPREAAPGSHWAAGAWCFCGQEQLFPDWDERFRFAPEPLTDPGTAAMASRAAQALAVRELMGIAKILSAEAEAYPAGYWQTLLAPFMIEAASQIVERALRVQAMIRRWGGESLKVALLPAGCAFSFADEHDFTMRGSLGLQFNHWLLSRLIEWQIPDGWQAGYLDPYVLPPLPAVRKSFKDWMRDFLRDLANSMPFPKLKGMGLADAVRFSLQLRKPCKKQFKTQDLAVDFECTEALAQIPLPPNTGALFAKMLPESLKKLRHKPLKGKAVRPQLRVVPTTAAENAQLRQKLARWRAEGNSLAHCQHGGIYGHAGTPCAAALTEYSQEIFFTWGWKKQGAVRGNFIPMPAPLLSSLPKYRGGGERMIFVGTEMSAYGRRLDSHPSPLQYAAYRRGKKAFLKNLPTEIQARSSYRPYFPLPGTLADAEWLLPQFPEVELCQGALLPQLLTCKLLTIDHPGTTMLEALAAGIPFIAYWNKKAWPWAPEAASALEALACCGIWHDTPQSAARQAALIWGDVLHWWNTPCVRQGREAFAAQYALHEANWRDTWNNMLENL